MNLELPVDHPLAQALMNSTAECDDPWLVVRGPGPRRRSMFRALVKHWTVDSDVLTVDFETWEQYTDRLAEASGL